MPDQARLAGKVRQVGTRLIRHPSRACRAPLCHFETTHHEYCRLLGFKIRTWQTDRGLSFLARCPLHDRSVWNAQTYPSASTSGWDVCSRYRLFVVQDPVSETPVSGSNRRADRTFEAIQYPRRGYRPLQRTRCAVFPHRRRNPTHDWLRYLHPGTPSPGCTPLT